MGITSGTPGPGRDESALCTATKASTGARCSAYALAGTEPAVCYLHSDRAKEARQKGGRNRRKAPVAHASTTTGPVVDLLSQLPMANHQEIRASMAAVVEGLRTGSLNPRVANVMVSAARVALQAAEQDVSDKIAQLEAAIEAQSPASSRRTRRR
jgi:hypothetical protein